MHCELANNESIDRRKSATPCGQLLHVYVLDTRAAKYKSREIDWTRPVAAWMPERGGEVESLGHCGCHWQARLASSLLSASCLWSSLHNASIDTVRHLPVCSAHSKCTIPAISPAEITIPPSSVPGPNPNLSLNPYPNPNNTNRNSVPYYAVHKFYYVLLHHNGSKTYSSIHTYRGGSVAEWLACWTQAQKARVQIAAATLSGNSLRQTVHTHCASFHQAAKFVVALLKVAGVTADLVESNGSLPPGL